MQLRLSMFRTFLASFLCVTAVAGCSSGESGCPPEAHPPVPFNRCFLKTDLQAERAEAGLTTAPDAGAAFACPTALEIQAAPYSQFLGWTVDSSTDHGDTCCYAGSTPTACE